MAESITSDTLTLVEVMLPKMDIPDFLRGDAGAGGAKQPRLIGMPFGNHQRSPGQQQPGREHLHSSGSSVVSGTTTAAINRLNQPSR
jgi:hypothetical protein